MPSNPSPPSSSRRVVFRRVKGRIIPIRVKYEGPSVGNRLGTAALVASAAAVGGFLGARRAVMAGKVIASVATKAAKAADVAAPAAKKFSTGEGPGSAYAYVRKYGGIFIKPTKNGTRIRKFKGSK